MQELQKQAVVIPLLAFSLKQLLEAFLYASA
jgi:hypothetical protein